MKSVFIKLFLVLLVFLIGGGAGFMYRQKAGNLLQPQTKDPYFSFLSEAYETIRDNYWDKISEENLVELFQAGTEKLVGQPQSLKKRDRENLEKMEKDILERLKEPERKKEYAVKLADVVLSNLKPFGRSRLYTKKEEKALAENVKNITGVDYYETLGVKKDASAGEIALVYTQKTAALRLRAATDPKAKEELGRIEQAYRILSDKEARKLYDAAGIEPTIVSKIISPDILYLHLTKMSPTSFDELKRTVEKFDKEAFSSLILDLSDNIGGSIDHLPFMIGPFIGNDQYAFQTFHQGEKTDFKTRVGWLPGLVKYKKVVVLVNNNTQSSAEVMAAALKKYNVGVLVGKPTKGWGTVERVFELKNQPDQTNKYSIFLVHSLTLREDGQPIEGKGVEPAINIDSPNWQAQLLAYFNYPELTRAVEEVWENK